MLTHGSATGRISPLSVIRGLVIILFPEQEMAIAAANRAKRVARCLGIFIIIYIFTKTDRASIGKDHLGGLAKGFVELLAIGCDKRFAKELVDPHTLSPPFLIGIGADVPAMEIQSNSTA